MTAGPLAACAVLAQLGYPLVHGVLRQELSAVVALLLALAVLAHAGRRNRLWLLAVGTGGSLLLELWGVHTGDPFGGYAYTGHLGPRLAGVPLVVPLMWTAMAWPALCVGRRLAADPLLRVAVGAFALTGWDLLLDPQLVAAGDWRWRPDRLALHGVPLHNDLGWLVSSLLLLAVLDRVCSVAADDRLPVGLWLWSWLGSVLADTVLLGLSGAAVTGGLAMALVGLPLLSTVVPRPRLALG